MINFPATKGQISIGKNYMLLGILLMWKISQFSRFATIPNVKPVILHMLLARCI